jgi:hypothetical protein
MMVSNLQNHCGSFDAFVADLTEAAYPVALRHSGGDEWLDLELDLWRVLHETVQKWGQLNCLHVS